LFQSPGLRHLVLFGTSQIRGICRSKSIIQYNELNLQQFLMCWKYLDCGMGLNEILIAGQINR